MKRNRVILLVLLIYASTQQISLSIDHISTSYHTDGSDVYGSEMGGTFLHIDGEGFDLGSMENNKVFVCGQECPIQSVTQNTLSCITLPMADTSCSTVEVRVRGQVAYSSNHFCYHQNYTPRINHVFDSSSIAGKGIHLRGDLRTHSGLMWTIGDSICRGDSTDADYCSVAPDQEAGKHRISYSSVYGNSKSLSALWKKQHDQSIPHHIAILPTINQVSPPQTGPRQVITIQGSGFPRDISRLTVTVGSQQCEVLSSEPHEITCRLQNFSQQPTETKYIAGTGWNFQRFDYCYSPSMKDVLNRLDPRSSQQRSKTFQLRKPSFYNNGRPNCFLYKGYFKALVEGNYTFRGFVYGDFALFMNENASTPEIGENTEPIIWSDHSTGTSSYFNTPGNQIVSEDIYLQAGQYYYMELYHRKQRRNGHMEISVEVPNNDTNRFGEVYAVHKLQTFCEFQPEIIEFELDGASGGSFNLELTYKYSNGYTRRQVKTFAYNCSISTFISILEDFDMFSPYSEYMSGDRTMTDLNFIDENNSTVYNIVWKVYINRLRSTSHRNLQLTSDLTALAGDYPYFYYQVVQDHPPTISGNYELSIGQYNFSIPYSSNIDTLSNPLKENFSSIRVEYFGDTGYSSTWYIYYDNYPFEVPQLFLDTYELTGGLSGVEIQFTELRPFKDRIVYNFVDYEFLFEPSQKQNVLVTVDDDLLSACLGDCSFQYHEDSPIISQMQLNGTQLTILLAVVNISKQPLKKASFTVKDKKTGEICRVQSFNKTELICRFDDADQHPKLEAGELQVDVFTQKWGSLPQADIDPIHIPLILQNVSPNSGSQNGGFEAEIKGNGFPFLLSEDIEITLCEQIAEILSVNNTLIQIKVPSCKQAGKKPLSVKVNSVSESLQFTYETASSSIIIESLSPSSSCPVIKKAMEITGSGFGTDESVLKVWLKSLDRTKVYPMKVLSLTNEMMKVGLSGGIANEYFVEIHKENEGISIPKEEGANRFKYQTVIESISPTTGSEYGGTTLTITGRNFSPEAAENLVFIGNQLNTFCEIISFSETEIKCKTPPKPSSYEINETQEIDVFIKVTEKAQCHDSNGCSFIYESFNGPTIEDIYFGEEGISCEMSGEILGGNYSLALRNIDTLEQISIEDWEIVHQNLTNFCLPAIESGKYLVFFSSQFGASNGATISVPLQIMKADIVVSDYGGKIQLTGLGLPRKWPHEYFALSTSSIEEVIVIDTSLEKSTFQIPEFSSQINSFSITLKSPVNSDSIQVRKISFGQCGYAEIEQLEDGNFNISIQKGIEKIDEIHLISLSNPDVYYIKSDWEQVDSTVIFEHQLYAGGWQVKILAEDQEKVGWCFGNDIQIPLSGDLQYEETVLGGGGGWLSLESPEISEGAILKVGSQISQFSYRNDGTAYFRIPSPSQVVDANIYSLQQIQSTVRKNRNFIKLLKKNNVDFQYISDSQMSGEKAFDTYFRSRYSSPNQECYVGIEILSDYVYMSLKKIVLKLPKKHGMKPSDFNGIRFEGTKDGANWEEILKKDKFGQNKAYTFKEKRGEFDHSAGLQYKAIRMFHSAQGGCSVNRVKFVGSLKISNNIQPQVTFYDGNNTVDLTGSIKFDFDRTPTIERLSQTTGDLEGGYNLTLYGRNLNLGEVKVGIDSINCPVQSSNASEIVCTVQEKPENSGSRSFEVEVGKSFAVIEEWFYYATKWSDDKTWGIDFAPEDGDLIHVPAGQTLFVDTSTPKLEGILVEGSIVFLDERDITVTTRFILINGGSFYAGDENKPFTHELTFQLTGSFYSHKKLPTFGDKFIACLDCLLSMHGKEVLAWTSLQETAEAGDLIIEVVDEVDGLWREGDLIVLASTAYDQKQVEVREVASIVNDSIIILNETLKYQHLSEGRSGEFRESDFRGEVGLLRRNIRIRGVENFEGQNYGVSVVIRGDSRRVFTRIENVEISQCGKEQYMYDGIYEDCMRVEIDGPADSSIIRNTAIYDGYGRGLYIPKGLELTVNSNVIAFTAAECMYVGGVESSITITNNLLMNTRRLQGKRDTSLNVLYLAGPSSYVEGNHLAGGPACGIHYDTSPDREGTCPWGLPLGSIQGNSFHSFNSWAIYIDKLSPRSDPCGSEGTYSWSLDSLTVYRNRYGVYIHDSGKLIVENCVFADNGKSLHISYDGMTTEKSKVMNTSFFGALDPTQDPSQVMLHLPQTDGFSAQHVEFAYANSQTTAVMSCDRRSGGYRTGAIYEYWMNSVSYNQFEGKYVRFLDYHRKGKGIIYSDDGTFTNGEYNTPTAIVTHFHHLASDQNCTTLSRWENAVLCNQVTVLPITLSINRYSYSGGSMYLKQMNSFDETENSNAASSFYIRYYRRSSDNVWDHDIPVVMGRVYNFYRSNMADWTTLKITPSSRYTEGVGGVVIKHHHRDRREVYDVFSYYQGQLNDTQAIRHVGVPLQPDSCSFGDYYHDNQNKVVALCVGYNNWRPESMISANAVCCREECPCDPCDLCEDGCDPCGPQCGLPCPPKNCTNNTNDPNCPNRPVCPNVTYYINAKKWSLESTWPNDTLPEDGDNVIIEEGTTVILDVDTPSLNSLVIGGKLKVPKDRDAKIQAKSIWVKGQLVAGSSSSPHTNHLEIQLTGQESDPSILDIDSLNDNKLLLVTGTLSLYGNPPSTVSAKLVETAEKASTSITVSSCTGWKVGDQLAISPSFSDHTQTEFVEIQQISSNTITFSPQLKHTHYGSSTFTHIDTRTSVAHLSRNMKITSGNDDNWGYRVVAHGYYDECDGQKDGLLQVDGVQFVKGGQFDSSFAAAISLYEVTPESESFITNSAIHHCQSSCLALEAATNFVFQDNVIVSATNYHILSSSQNSRNRNKNKNITIQANLLLNAHANQRSSKNNQRIACIEWRETVKRSIHNVEIKDNLCQGSEGAGFSRHYYSCADEQDSVWTTNSVGSAAVGYVLHGGADQCSTAQDLRAYACGAGVVGHPRTGFLSYKKLMMVECEVGVVLKVVQRGTQIEAMVEDSYFSAIEKDSCPNCYGNEGINCKGMQAITMFTSIERSIRSNKYDASFSDAFKQAAIDCAAFLNNVTFKNYQHSYGESGLDNCGANFVFGLPPAASELIASHHLFNATYDNCSDTSMVHFDDPIKEAACGDMVCTGKLNCLVEDHDTGKVWLPNSQVGEKQENCTFEGVMNGYQCEGSDFMVVETEGIGRDKSRQTWPVNMSQLDSEGNFLWTSTINAYKTWGGRRLNRYVSLIASNSRYNMSFSAAPPKDMLFRVQNGGAAEVSEWAIIKILYLIPNSIRVEVDGETIEPLMKTDEGETLSGQKNTCGENIYHYNERVIQFVITNEEACIPRLTVANNVKLSIKMDMKVKDFFEMDGKTKLIDRICALLDIRDRSRVKVVGVFKGSVDLTIIIEDERQPIENNSTDQENCTSDGTNTTDNCTNEPKSDETIEEEMEQLSQKLDELIKNNELQEQLAADGFGQIVQITSQLFYANRHSSLHLHPCRCSCSCSCLCASNCSLNCQPEPLSLVFILLIVCIPLLIIVFGIIIYCYRQNKARKTKILSQLYLEQSDERIEADEKESEKASQIVQEKHMVENLSIIPFGLQVQ